ncbi:MAG: M23 family metallopeptidase [Gammaproteobacteria bacterium]|nr:M23 family metallopeptidase [Gammaproteobacteria bacterium]MDH3449562.1 M23 family metallopeptidase [Gammaproteobacteria bacterium]
MSNFPLRQMTIMLLLATLPACGVYEKYGHGWLARSRLPQAEATPVILPANAPSISQRFRPQTGPSNGDHRGFDILVPARTPVLAAADGQVERVTLSLLYGNQVFLNHGRSIAGFRIQTRYFHLSEKQVGDGETVQRGQLLGYSGATGMAGVYPHLHFEVHRLDDADPPAPVRFLDPQLFWVDGEGRVTCYDPARAYPLTPTALTYPVPCRDIEWRP